MTENKKSALEQLRNLYPSVLLKEDGSVCQLGPSGLVAAILELAERVQASEAKLEALESQVWAAEKLISIERNAREQAINDSRTIESPAESVAVGLGINWNNDDPTKWSVVMSPEKHAKIIAAMNETNDARTIELPEEVYEALDTVGLYRLADYSGAIVSDKYLADFRDRIRAETNDSRTIELPDDAFQHLVEVYQGAGATYQDDTPIVECESVTFIRQKKESK